MFPVTEPKLMEDFLQERMDFRRTLGRRKRFSRGLLRKGIPRLSTRGRIREYFRFWSAG
jgi:hypothetical protein